jgi:tripartite-type tricarboxylate transporter receptor subunit TctC
MKLPRRNFLHLAAGAAALPAVSRIAGAQTYPMRPVRLIVPFAAGGGTDITARVMGQWLSERLGQQFVIDNRPGGGTNIGTEAVVRAPADGYTLLLAGSPAAINATLYDKLNYNFIRDIAPVAGIIRQPFVMAVHPSVPAKTVPEFIAYAKANPGRINMASAGTGAGSHVTGELFKMMAGVDMVHVPYRGAGPALTDLLAGQVQVYSPPLSHRLGISGLAGCARSQSPPRRARTRCRTSRPWVSSCRVTRRAPGTASARRRSRRPRSSTSSTRRSTLASPIPR